MRLLHAGPNHLSRRTARGGPHRLRDRDPRVDERQHLPLRRLPEHRRGHPAGCRGEPVMRPFTYSRASDVGAAVAQVAAEPDAAFVAGATELANWMKIGIQTPTHLVDINALPLAEIT